MGEIQIGYNIHYLETARDKGSNPWVNIYILRTGYIDDFKITTIRIRYGEVWERTVLWGKGLCQ